MSDNGNGIVGFLIGLMVGAFFGAIFALLYAPEAGEELRAKIQSGAEANWQKANLELEQIKGSLQKQSSQPQEEAPTPPVES